MIKKKLPNGKEAKLCPAPVITEYLTKNKNTLSCAPKLGEHNESVLLEVGLTKTEISSLRSKRII